MAAEPTKRYAVVTGSNRGIGYEICRQLAAKGIVVLLTARDEKRGLEAVHKLRRDCHLADSQLLFHQLDVTDIASVSSLADFVRTQFGKLDILVNNAGIVGVIMHEAALRASGYGKEGAKVNWNEVTTQNYELAEKCLETNYYGAKRMVEALISLLQLSDSPRIVNVSSFMGMLKNVPNEWAKGMLSDVEKLTEERVEIVLREFLSDFKELGCGAILRSKGWPSYMAANIVSKASMNAYTRILARRYPNFCINSVCPTSVKTDINFNMGILPVEEGAASPLRLALLPDGGPTGRFFIRFKDSSF